MICCCHHYYLKHFVVSLSYTLQVVVAPHHHFDDDVSFHPKLFGGKECTPLHHHRPSPPLLLHRLPNFHNHQHWKMLSHHCCCPSATNVLHQALSSPLRYQQPISIGVGQASQEVLP